MVIHSIGIGSVVQCCSPMLFSIKVRHRQMGRAGRA